MKLTQATAEIYVPDGLEDEKALARTTHLAVSAHQDDIEIMAADGILKCFQRTDRWFTGVVVSDGRGSPRDDLYKDYSDEDMHVVRFIEQKKAAMIGEYAAVALLDFPSKAVKDPHNLGPVNDLLQMLRLTKPQVVYTHNLADKHDTHVSTALRLIQAARQLPAADRPQKVYGCEVWRDLDWMADADKTVFDLSGHPNLQNALVSIFDSQICGGKRYDLATMGRRATNATYFASHDTDTSTGMSYAMDLTPLVADPSLDIWAYVHEFCRHFVHDIEGRLKQFGGA